VKSAENIAISFESVSKMFRRPESEQKGGTYFQALSEVSFELHAGEILGVIGRNGSGKSTLLKMISGITKPSSGVVRVNGTIASILDVGMGFHPDLSGRDNIYLKGQLMGLSETEVAQQFDRIVEFSGIRSAIDSRIKDYSSGMFLRLAFSTLLHIKTDILVLDEVLSVGDAEFRVKCARKIREMFSEGRTIVMVSHDMQAILDNCSKVLLLEEGCVKGFGKPHVIVSDNYLTEIDSSGKNNSIEGAIRPDQIHIANAVEDGFSLLKLNFLQGKTVFDRSEDIRFFIEYEINVADRYFGMTVTDIIGNRLFDDTPMERSVSPDASLGIFNVQWTIPRKLLAAGNFRITVFVFDESYRAVKLYPNTLEFKVVDSKNNEESVYRAPLKVDLSTVVKKLSS